ncbi:hypothetical protein, partial [Duncaniella muris]|uniref:hypothetical protein n=1 Tax=Duncaniella muris TaxID=2094150 RepID=UPI003F668D32
WAKGSVIFWLKGSIQPGLRGHPSLGFPPKYSSAFLRLLVIRSISELFRLVSMLNFAVNMALKYILQG